MREPTAEDIRTAERALERVKQLARAALHVMGNVELEDHAGNDPQGDAVFILAELLRAIDAAAAAGQTALLPTLAS